MNRTKTLYIVAGPTAVGKTRFAIELAQLLNTEILSADSRQFYKEMRIGTAVPSSEELADVPHHFIQHLSIHHDYNVHRYEKDAMDKMNQLFEKFDDLVLVGGSGLYLNAVAYGIDDLPDPSAETRAFLEEVQQKKGLDGLRKLLQEKDPDFYKLVDLHNPNRIKRALEVCITTGKPYSSLRVGQAKERDFKIKWIGLLQEREQLYEKINRRVDLMIEEGLIDEVKSLFELKHLNALNTVGYREFFQWMSGEESYEWAVEKVKTNSRRYAKRQMTWFRKNKEIYWLDVEDTEEINSFKKKLLLND
jgi:tRNA dimethylallyltransferase